MDDGKRHTNGVAVASRVFTRTRAKDGIEQTEAMYLAKLFTLSTLARKVREV
jgi:hypothetical protein